MSVLVFFVGCVAGFLACAAMTVDLLKRNGLLDASGKIMNLRREEEANDTSL